MKVSGRTSNGHEGTNSGLQKHSVGDDYPLTVVGIGDNWQVMNLLTGYYLGTPTRDCKEAHEAMRYFTREGIR